MHCLLTLSIHEFKRFIPANDTFRNARTILVLPSLLPMKKIKLLAFLLLLNTGAMAQSNRNVATINKAVTRHIEHVMHERNIPGLSVAVMQGDQLLFSKGLGYANLEHQIPVTTKSIFQIASITKVFTAIATLKLYEQGKIDLDDSIGQYLPYLPEHWHAITIRQLLNHTSGIKSFSSYEKIPCVIANNIREYQKGDVLNEVACLPLEFEPGEKWAYGDTGFYIAGLLIEKVSGQLYEDFLRNTLFVPLDMKETRLINYRDIIPNRVDGYSFENGRYYNARTFDFDEFSNGGIVSSVEDMIKMHVGFTTEKLLKTETLAVMCTPTRLTNGELINYGLGIGLTPFNNQKRYGHTGGGGLGFSTALTHFPEKKLTVVVLSNADQPAGTIGELANEIAAFYLD